MRVLGERYRLAASDAHTLRERASEGCRPKLPRWPWRSDALICSCPLLETMGDLRLSLFAYRLGARTHARVVVQTPCSPVESQHARGLTMQRSQGQGRQPLRPEGAPPAAGVLRLHAARAVDGGEEAAGYYAGAGRVNRKSVSIALLGLCPLS